MLMNPYQTPTGVPDRNTEKPSDARPHVRRFSRRGGCVALAIHSAAVIGFSFLVFSGLRQSPEAAMAWTLWMLSDFPLSIGAIPSEPVLKALLIETIGVDYFYGFAFGAYFLVMGGAQYYFLFGWVSGYIAQRRAGDL
jgi:hypothetical protein